MKATDEMLQDGLEAAYPGLENMSAASQAWAKDKVAKVTAAVLARVPTGWDKQTDADWSAATGCYTPALAKDHVEDLRRRVAELEQENEDLGVRVSDAEGHAPDGKTVASLDAENAKLRAELADAQAQARHAEALLAVYDNTQLEAAMVCLESLAKLVGGPWTDGPHVVEEIDAFVRDQWGHHETRVAAAEAFAGELQEELKAEMAASLARRDAFAAERNAHEMTKLATSALRDSCIGLVEDWKKTAQALQHDYEGAEYELGQGRAFEMSAHHVQTALDDAKRGVVARMGAPLEPRVTIRPDRQELADAAVVMLSTRPTDPAPAAAGDDHDAAIVLTPIPDADVVNVLRFLLSAHDACMGDGRRFELETKAMEAFARLEQAVSQ